MKITQSEIGVRTSKSFELVDITAEVQRAVSGSGVADGIALICSPHTTAAIRVNEKEERLHEDMERFLAGLADRRASYRHDAQTVDDRPNAWAHLMTLLMGSSAAVPVHAGRLELGGWQAVFFVELDGPRQGRKALVKIMGE